MNIVWISIFVLRILGSPKSGDGVKGRRKGFSGRGGSRDPGFTLLEVLVAVSVLAVGILAVASMQVTAIRGNRIAGAMTEALNLATDRLEKLSVLPYETVASAATPETSGPYTVNWTVTADSPLPKTKSVEVVVSWIDRGHGRQVTLRHILAEIRGVAG